MQKLLLHTCCAPCSIAIIDELKSQFDLSVLFYNPNIFLPEEYDKRKAEVIKVCQEWNVLMIDQDREAELWHEKVAVGLENALEGSERCALCFRFRMAKAAEYAAKNGFQYFSTSLTSGRNKPAEVINPIGHEFARYYNIKFYDVDWKRGGRQEKAKEMIDKRSIYRQSYCGCENSMSGKT